MKADEWAFGVNGEKLQNSTKVGVKAVWECCSASKLWGKFDAEFPPKDAKKNHQSVAGGMAFKHDDWEHYAQVTMNLANKDVELADVKNGEESKKGDVDYNGFMGTPVFLQMGANFKASKETDF